MLKETPRSLRLFFGIVAFLYALMFAGAVSQIVLLLREKPDAQISALFVAQTVFHLVVACALAYVVAKFGSLIKNKPMRVKAVIHANFVGSLVFALIYIISGAQLNYLGLLISFIVYIYLLKSVNRISKEALEPKTA